MALADILIITMLVLALFIALKSIYKQRHTGGCSGCSHSPLCNICQKSFTK